MQNTDLLLWTKRRAWLSRRSVLCQLKGVLECGVIFARSWFLVTFHFALFCSFHKFCSVSFLIVVRCPSVFSNGQGDQTDWCQVMHYTWQSCVVCWKYRFLFLLAGKMKMKTSVHILVTKIFEPWTSAHYERWCEFVLSPLRPRTYTLAALALLL